MWAQSYISHIIHGAPENPISAPIPAGFHSDNHHLPLDDSGAEIQTIHKEFARFSSLNPFCVGLRR